MRPVLDRACASRLEISARPLEAARTSTLAATTATTSPIGSLDLIIIAPLPLARMFAPTAKPVNGALRRGIDRPADGAVSESSVPRRVTMKGLLGRYQTFAT